MSALATAGLDEKVSRYLETMMERNPALVDTLERAAIYRMMTAPRESNAQPSNVYFAQQGYSGPVKIGASSNPRQRVRELQTGSSEQITLIGSMPGGYAEEKDLHSRFAAHRITGEWFAPAPEILSYIAGVAS